MVLRLPLIPGAETVEPDDPARDTHNFGALLPEGRMRRDGKLSGRPWRRRRRGDTDPATVLRELQRRQLNDLEDCRIACERAVDPLAVCAAVAKSDMPEWLTDAVLVLLTDGARGAKTPHALA